MTFHLLQKFQALLDIDPDVSGGFGQAAVLGANGGDDDACESAYPDCPRDRGELLESLSRAAGAVRSLLNQL